MTNGLDYEDLRKSQDEIGLTVRRALFAFMAISLFTFATIGASDQAIFEQRGFSVPFAGSVRTSVTGFLIAAPLVAISIWIYLQVFLAELRHPRFRALEPRILTLPMLSGAVPRALTVALTVPLLPALLFSIAFRANFHPNASLWFWGATAASFVLFVVRFKRASTSWGRGLWVLAALLAISIGGYFALSPSEASRRSRLNFEDSKFISHVFSGMRLDFAQFDRARLDGSKFREASLTSTDFRGAELTSADFWGAQLERADLSHAVAPKAIFTIAKLRDTVMIGTDLRRANLRGADLSGADLRGADLTAADFSETTGLQEEQVINACYNGKEPPILPAGIEAPSTICEKFGDGR